MHKITDAHSNIQLDFYVQRTYHAGIGPKVLFVRFGTACFWR